MNRTYSLKEVRARILEKTSRIVHLAVLKHFYITPGTLSPTSDTPRFLRVFEHNKIFYRFIPLDTKPYSFCFCECTQEGQILDNAMWLSIPHTLFDIHQCIDPELWLIIREIAMQIESKMEALRHSSK
jgi:hypothetical protein